MIETAKRITAIIVLCSITSYLWAAGSFEFNGHVKYRFLHTRYPADSIYNSFSNSDATDQNADIRLNSTWQTSNWNLQTDYQLIAIQGDSLRSSRQLPPLAVYSNTIQNDDRRLFDLSRTVHEEQDQALLHRLDRFYIGHTSKNTVIRFGRQAISWGNGLIYTPMDFFNPFDPSAIDKEYKTGDDMVYGQYLFNNGNDIQAVSVIRRNSEHDVDSDVISTAIKYHGLKGNGEFDLLLSRHYTDNIISFGGNLSIGGAVWHGDITVTETENETINSIVTGLSFSWVWGETNYSGIVEYFYNGFGIDADKYSITMLTQSTDLLDRIQRGELFTIGQQYLAASATIELTPLWVITPTLFHNLSDSSSLFQLLSRHDLSQNLQLILAIDIPNGSSGTEFGGIETDISDLNLSSDHRFFAQLAWYF